MVTYNTRELKAVKEATTKDIHVRVRLWTSLPWHVPQNDIPDDLRPLPIQPRTKQNANKNAEVQEIERKQSSGPVPSSPLRARLANGYCGMTPATYFVDSVGNVISPSAVTDALTFASVDHIFPYSRGGLSRCLNRNLHPNGDSNLVMMQNESNKVKTDLFQQHFVR